MLRGRSSFVAMCVGVALALGASPATAAGKARGAAAARDPHAEGIRLYKQGRYAEARAAFVQASARGRGGDVKLMIGMSSLGASRYRDAVAELDAFLDENPDPPAKKRALAASARREARARLAQVKEVAPEGAEIVVDGAREEPSGEGLLELDPGPHVVAVRHADGTTEREIEAVTGTLVEVRIAPGPPGPPRPERPRAPVPVAPEGSTPTLLSPPATVWPVYVAGAIGLAGLGTAAALGGLRANAAHAREVAEAALTRSGAGPTRCAEPATGTPYHDACSAVLRSDATRRDLDAPFVAATLLGAAGLTVAVGYYLLGPKERADERRVGRAAPRVAPWIGVGTGGASVEGSF